ncbi:procathepsin L-like [Aricia agestis]|uniref:procathepsin L-like n=1 Tax=Aricia agestis TaxID=91739 RepID=UPI001C2029E9|nr:procathepsin L-like [Aricia agestis]
MRSLALLVLVVGALGLDDLDQEWTAYKAKHNKKYGAEEDPYRRSLFHETKRKVEEHNRKHAAGLVSYSQGINHFSDLTKEELSKRLSCLRGSLDFDGPRVEYQRPEHAVVPDEIDWRTKGAVTRVQDQGSCGSCWAFSAIAALEGQHFLKNGTLVDLSEQNLVDCDERDSQCQGGWPFQAYVYIAKQGVDTEVSYPYDSWDGTPRECRFNADTVGATDSAVVFIKKDSEEDLKHAVATVGPVSVAVDSRNFASYNGSVFYVPECSSDHLDHAVTVVGYGTEAGEDYWLVKNSWGRFWGLEGYIKLARNRDNHCGIATMAVYPVV